MNRNIWIYILVSFVVVYLIRVLPLTLIRKPIKNRFIKSFLYYVPYITLAVMTFPAIIEATQIPVAGIAALLIGIVVALFGGGLFSVASVCCVVVFVLEWFLVRWTFYSRTKSTTVALHAFIKSCGASASCIPRTPALMWIFSCVSADESIKVRSFFFIPNGEQPPRT